MGRVFISYAHVDEEFVRRLCADLASHRVEYWLDSKDIRAGQSISAQIERALRQVDHVCICLSPASISRPWVQREYRATLTLQLGSRKPRPQIIPIVIDDCRIPVFLRDIRYGKFSPSYLRGLRELLTSIGVDCPLATPYESLFRLLGAALPINASLVPEDLKGIGGRVATLRFLQPKTESRVLEFKGHSGRDIIECIVEGIETTNTDFNALLHTRQRFEVYENLGLPTSKPTGIRVIIGRPLWAFDGGDFGKRYGNRVWFELSSFMEFTKMLINHRQSISSRQAHFLPEEFD